MSDFSAELRRLRDAAGRSQGSLATALGVKRPTVTQWETGRHLPSAAHVEQVDRLLDAGGALVAAARGTRTGSGGATDRPASGGRQATGGGTPVSDVLRGVGDRLIESIRTDETTGAIGWGHKLNRSSDPSPWSTAVGVRTMQLLDRVDVDLHGMARTLLDRQHAGGWSNRSLEVPRPEVTAIVLDVLSRLGRGGPSIEAAWTWLDEHFDDQDADVRDLDRPFVVSTVLDCTARIRPAVPLVGRLARRLLESRGDAAPLWTANPRARTAAPSLAHTARAVVALRSALPGLTDLRAEAEDAADAAMRAVVESDDPYGGVVDVMEVRPGSHGLDVPVAHFTAAHVLRALAGSPRTGFPANRHRALAAEFWSAYSSSERVWTWRLDGSLPIWMTLDAVLALRESLAAGMDPGSPSPLTPLPAQEVRS